MGSKLHPYIIKYKTKKVKPGERVIRARNAADAIARLKNDVEGLIKIEEPRLVSSQDLEMRRKMKDRESVTKKPVPHERPLRKPITAKYSKSKKEIVNPMKSAMPKTPLHASKQYDRPVMECFDMNGIFNDIILMLECILDDLS